MPASQLKRVPIFLVKHHWLEFKKVLAYALEFVGSAYSLNNPRHGLFSWRVIYDIIIACSKFARRKGFLISGKNVNYIYFPIIRQHLNLGIYINSPDS